MTDRLSPAPVVRYAFCTCCHAKRGIPTTCTSCRAAICDECVDARETRVTEPGGSIILSLERLCYECSDRRRERDQARVRS